MVVGNVAVTCLTIVYSTVYSDADQRKHQSSESLAFVRGIHRGPVNSLHKWPVTRNMFPFDDVIMVRQLDHHCDFRCRYTQWYQVPTGLMLSTHDKDMVRFIIQTMLSEVVNDILHGITTLKNDVAWNWKSAWYGSFSNCKILRGSYAFFVNVGEYCWLWYKSHLFVTQTFSTNTYKSTQYCDNEFEVQSVIVCAKY